MQCHSASVSAVRQLDQCSVNSVACGGPLLPTSVCQLPSVPGSGHMCAHSMEISPCDSVLPASNNVRSGLADLVREVKRKSLRRRKLWMNPDNDLQITDCDQNKNFGAFTRKFVVFPHDNQVSDTILFHLQLREVKLPTFPA